MRRTVIPSHLRFIEWPQMHGDANKYWATVGPQFHGGPMVLNASLAKKAFRSSSMFARKFDVALYPDALTVWDRWMLWGGAGALECIHAGGRWGLMARRRRRFFRVFFFFVPFFTCFQGNSPYLRPCYHALRQPVGAADRALLHN